MQPDGGILVGGEFTTLGGATRNRLGRLTATGSLDATSDPGANGVVDALALQPDGSVVVGGEFTKLGGGTGTTTRNHLGRLTAAGGLDMSFDPGASNYVLTLVVQPDGMIVVGGVFTGLGGGTGATLIKAVHITELRTRIEALRTRFGRPTPYPYADPILTVGTTMLRAQHMLDLRAALADAFLAAGLSAPAFTTPVALGAPVTSAAIAELRAAVIAIE